MNSFDEQGQEGHYSQQKPDYPDQFCKPVEFVCSMASLHRSFCRFAGNFAIFGLVANFANPDSSVTIDHGGATVDHVGWIGCLFVKNPFRGWFC